MLALHSSRSRRVASLLETQGRPRIVTLVVLQSIVLTRWQRIRLLQARGGCGLRFRPDVRRGFRRAQAAIWAPPLRRVWRARLAASTRPMQPEPDLRAAGVAGLGAEAGAPSSAGLPGAALEAVRGLFRLGRAAGMISAMLSLRIRAKPYAVSTLNEPSSKPTTLPTIFEPSLRRISSARTPAARAKIDRAAQRNLLHIANVSEGATRAASSRGD